MIPNVIPPKEVLKKFKRPSINHDVWKRAPLFLCVALLLVMGISFMITYSGPKTADVGIASADDCSTVNGMTAYQCDFSTTIGTNMKTTDSMLRTNFPAPVYSGGGSGGFGGTPVNSYGADVKGRKTNEGDDFLSLGFSSDEPTGDVKLPMNAYLPGRGQNESGYPLLGFEWNMIPGGGGMQVWNFDAADLSNTLDEPVNISCVQRISTEMLNRVFGGNNSQYCGVVMVNDCAGAGKKPQILVLRLKYSNGKARLNTYRQFRLDSNPGQDTADGFPATKVKALLDGGAGNTWYHRLNSDGSCNNNYINKRWQPDAGGVYHWYADIFKYNPDSSPPNSTSAINYSSSGHTGYLHDVHMIPDGTSSYAFYTTIVNWGVYAFRPVTSTPGSTDDRLNRPWCYPMYTMSKDYVAEQGSHQASDWCTAPDGTIVLIWSWTIRDTGKYTQRLEQSTSWSCQPLNSGLVDISVSPWKSYVNNDPPDANHPNSLRNRLQAFQGNSTWYNKSINYWNGTNWANTYDGYPWSNNDSGQYVARSEVVRVQESDNTVVHNYGPGITDDSKPYWGGNMTPGRASIQNDSNYFNVGDDGNQVLGLGGADHMGDVMHLDPKSRPRIWGSGIAGEGIKVPGKYNETAFPFPNGNILVNGSGDHANGHGTPTVLDKSGNTLWTLAGANDTYYTHFGAGVFPAYGTSKPTDSGWSILGKSYKEIYNYRDGGFASQLGPAPNISYVRDFSSMKVNGLDRAENNPDYGSNSKIAYALADSDGNIFMDPSSSSNPNLNQASGTIDLSGLVKPDGTGKISTNLEKYQQIYLNSLMWGDIGNNIGTSQMSNSPILKSWGISYTDKTAKLDASKVGIGGIYKSGDATYGGGNDPTDNQYKDSTGLLKDGSNLFYTKKDQNMARYKVGATNDGEWSANNVVLKDVIRNDTGGTDAKTTFYTQNSSNPAPTGYVANKAYYRVIPKGGGTGTQGTLTVSARGDKDEWTDSPNYQGCGSRGWCNGIPSGFIGDSCGADDLGCQYSCSGTDEYWPGISCGHSDTGCQQYSGCTGAHESKINCADTALGDKWCGFCTGEDCCAGYGTWPFSEQYCSGCTSWETRNRPCRTSGDLINTCSCYLNNGFKCRTDLGDKCYRTKFQCYTPGAHHVVWPKMEVWVNGTKIGEQTVNSSTSTNYSFNYNMGDNDCVEIKFNNDSSHSPTDCNLYVDSVSLNSGDPIKAASVTNTPCNSLHADQNGADMLCNGSLVYKCASSIPYQPIPDANINVSGTKDFTFPDGPTVKVGGTMSFTIPSPYVPGRSPDVINNGDRVEVIYTTNIVKAGKIKNDAYFAFKNVGNSVWAQTPSLGQGQSSPCTGNAPFIKTSLGDVYLGGGVHPYYAYGNATFLIQTGTGSLTNFNSPKKGWVQNNYNLAPELQLDKGSNKNVFPTLRQNLGKLETAGNLAKIEDVATINHVSFNGTDWLVYELDVNKLANLGPGKVGVVVDNIWPYWLELKGNMPADMGAKVIYVKGAYGVSIKGNITYSSLGNPTSLDKLASLGVVVDNTTAGLNIASGVTEADGAYIVNGNINTCNDGFVTDPNQIAKDCDQQLRTSGLWVAKSFSLNRSHTENSITGYTESAELVTYDGRVALNPPGGFSVIGDILPIWREVAP